jgi:hypothetical protein
MAAIAGVSFAIGHFLALGLPVAGITYLAYLSRPIAGAGARDWFPVGRLMLNLAVYAGALPVLVLPLIGGSYQGLKAPMTEFVRQVSAQASPEMGMKPLTNDQVERIAGLLIDALPAAFAAYWLLIMAVNLYLAGRITRASGWLSRDWPDLSELSYPPGFALLLALSLAATLLNGWPGIAGASFTGALIFAYLFAGLALVHTIAAVRAPWLTWATYFALVLAGPYTVVALALLGFVEPIIKLRRRFGPPPARPTQ